jgi:hypothetical protein
MTAINDNGQLVANAYDIATSQTHALLMTLSGSTQEWLICSLLATPGIGLASSSYSAGH